VDAVSRDERVISTSEARYMTLREAAETWGVSRTMVFKLLHNGQLPGAYKGLHNGQMSWRIPANVDYTHTEWYERIKANQVTYAHHNNSAILRGTDTEESYILRNEALLSIEQLANNLHTTTAHVRAVYDHIHDKRRDADG
jgi:excisionase family DNA binding protein